MIRIIPIDQISTQVIEGVIRDLNRVFAVGCEVFQGATLPKISSKGAIDAEGFLKRVQLQGLLRDDVALFLTKRELADRTLLKNKVKTSSFSLDGRPMGIVSIPFDDRIQCRLGEEFSWEGYAGKLACHEVGHLFGLRHCVDATCLMYPVWTPEFFAVKKRKSGELAIRICDFCQSHNKSSALEGFVSGGGEPLSMDGEPSGVPADESSFRTH